MNIGAFSRSKRRYGLAAASVACVLAAAVGGCQQAPGTAEAGGVPGSISTKKAPEVSMMRKDGPPRKVIVGTVCHSMFKGFPGLKERCDELSTLMDRIAADSNAKYGRTPDLIVLSEFSLNDMNAPLAKRAIPVDSPAFEVFRKKARELHSYVVIPSIVFDGKEYGNAAFLLDRQGKTVGRYDKVHVVPDSPPATTLEGGTTPGRGYPVFDCDFGRVGIQICFDYMHEEGWHALAAQGAELIIHPSQSPSISYNAARAVNNHVYVVSSTWRDNATILEPTGMVAAQIKPPQEILVHQIDLEYRLLPWDGKLRDGVALQEKYGKDVGFNYYPSEDVGVFWSNNPAIPIDAMVRWLGIWTNDEYVARANKIYAELKQKQAAR
jgi:predicted amidohydrolase